jgi:hypothetical protein
MQTLLSVLENVSYALYILYYPPFYLLVDCHTQTVDGKIGGSFCNKITVLYFNYEENNVLYVYLF